MRPHALTCLLVLCIACISCDDDSTLVPRESDEIARARAAWIALGHHDYRFTQERLCFCPLGGQPVQLTVRADTLVSGMLLADSSMLAPRELQGYRSIDGLFDFVAGIEAERVAVFERSFDSTYHYPSHVWVDYDRNIADEEMGYRSYDFVPL